MSPLYLLWVGGKARNGMEEGVGMMMKQDYLSGRAFTCCCATFCLFLWRYLAIANKVKNLKGLYC